MQDFSFGSLLLRRDQSLHASPLRLSPERAILRASGCSTLLIARWNGQQVVAANWVHNSVKPLADTASVFFPDGGYGYMWWSGFASDWARTVTLPQETFFALGFGSPYLFVLPAHDLVVVHTVDMERERWPWASDAQLGRLMWLILPAAEVDDIGPDTSVTAADLLPVGRWCQTLP